MKKYTWQVTNYGVSIYPLCMLGEVLFYGLKPLYGANVKKGIGEFSNGTNRWASLPGSYDQLTAATAHRRRQNPNWPGRIIKQIYESCRVLLSHTAVIRRRDLGAATSRELLAWYEQYNQRFSRLYVFGWLPNAFEGNASVFSRQLEAVIRERTRLAGKADRAGEYFSVLTSPSKDSARDRERKDFLTLLSLRAGGPALHRRLRRHWQRYCWLQYDYDGPPLPFEYFVDQYRALKQSKLNPARELLRLADERRELGATQRRYRRQLRLTTPERGLFKLAAELAYIKNYRKDVLYRSYYELEPLLLEIGRRLHLTVRQVKHLLPTELAAALRGKRIDPRLLNERMAYSVVFYGPKKMSVLTGVAARRFIARTVATPRVGRQLTELSGQVAFSGSATGRVRIVNTVKDIGKVKAGDILVSEKTNPNLLPAMRRAAAIVTDIGGLTCHAAIVSRELRIPCVVGTKFATRLLRDGQLVEVDAVRGLVRTASSKKIR